MRCRVTDACTVPPTANDAPPADLTFVSSSRLSSVDFPVRYGPHTTTGQMRPLIPLSRRAAAGCSWKRPALSHWISGTA